MNFNVAALTDGIYKDLKKRLSGKKTPVLALISTTDGVGVRSYKKSIVKNLEPLGIKVVDYVLGEDQNELLETIKTLNEDENTNAILVLKPLAGGIDERVVDAAICPEKDVDGTGPENLGRVLTGEDAYVPCTAQGVLKLLEDEDIPVKGRKVVIVNNSQTIGKPLAMLLTNRFATVTLCHEFTRDLKGYTKDADIVVTGAGVSGLITPDMLKDGAVLIDVGVTTLKENGKDVLADGKKVRCGDASEACADKCSYITSLTPGLGGGTGPLTTALLAEHVVDSLERT